MSEAQAGALEPVAGRHGGDGITAGMLLRQAREAAGLHIAALAVALKVPPHKLEALERDRLDLLPDLVFARALAASLCRTLKIDPRSVLERLPQTPARHLTGDRDTINAPFRPSGGNPNPSWTEHISKPVVVAVFALLLGALVLVFLPSIPGVDAAPEAVSRAAVAPEAVGVPEARVSPVDSTPELVSPTAVVTPLPAPVLSPSVTLTIPPTVGTATLATGAAAAPGLVVFRATSPSWVQVTDARGVVALRRLLNAGESAGASGAVPLSVTIGSASGTVVQVRGQPFDLAPFSRDGVARFEVK